MCPSQTRSEERNHVYPEQRYEHSRADKDSRNRRPARGIQANQTRRLQVERRSQGSRRRLERRQGRLLQARWWLEGRQERRLPAAEGLLPAAEGPLRPKAVRQLWQARQLS